MFRGLCRQMYLFAKQFYLSFQSSILQYLKNNHPSNVHYIMRCASQEVCFTGGVCLFFPFGNSRNLKQCMTSIKTPRTNGLTIHKALTSVTSTLSSGRICLGNTLLHLKQCWNHFLMCMFKTSLV